MRTIARSMLGTATAGLVMGERAEAHHGARIAPAQVPTALRAFWADGLFGAAQDAFILAYLPLLAASLGASATQIGLLSAAQSLGSMLALYPGAMASRRASSRRWIVVFYGGVLARIILFASAFTVAFLHGNTALYTVIALFTLRAFLTNFTVPAWTSLAADIIPPGMRARYFASRNFAANLAHLAVTPLGGLVLDRFGFPGGYTIALLVSFLLGMLATLAYSRIPEPKAAVKRIKQARPSPRAVIRDGRFAVFVLATFILHFTTTLAGPFFNVYLVQDLGGSNFAVGLLSTAAALAGVAGQLFFGDVMARRGSLWLERAAILVLPTLPLMWLFITEPWMVLFPNMIGAFAWAAFYLANFQLLLDVTREEDRDEFTAAFHFCVFGALFVAPFVGGYLIDTVGYKTNFVISGLGRFVAAGLFFFAVSTPRERALRAWDARRSRSGVAQTEPG